MYNVQCKYVCACVEVHLNCMCTFVHESHFTSVGIQAVNGCVRVNTHTHTHTRTPGESWVRQAKHETPPLTYTDLSEVELNGQDNGYRKYK